MVHTRRRLLIDLLAMTTSGIGPLLAQAAAQETPFAESGYLPESAAHRLTSEMAGKDGSYVMTLLRLPLPDMIPGIIEADLASGEVWFVAGGGGFAGFTEAPLSWFGKCDAAGNCVLYRLQTPRALPNGISLSESSIAISQYLANRIAVIDRKTMQCRDYPVPTPDSRPTGIVIGADEIWFCENAGHKIGFLKGGQIREFAIPTGRARPTGIALHPGRKLVAFSEMYGNKIGLFSAETGFAEIPLLSENARPTFLSFAGGDGNTVLVSERGANRMALVDIAQKSVQEITLPPAESGPFGSRLARDGSIWVALMNSNSVLNLAPDGRIITKLTVPVRNAMPGGLCLDGAGNIWVTLHGANSLLKISII